MPIFCFHNVLDCKLDEIDNKCSRISKNEFELFAEDMTQRYNYGTLSEAAENPNVMHFSFDDGYFGVVQNAFPLMEKYQFLGTLFLCSETFQKNGLFHFEELEIAVRTTRQDQFFCPILQKKFHLVDLESKVIYLKKIKKRLKILPENQRAALHAQFIDFHSSPEKIQSVYRSSQTYKKLSIDDVSLLHRAGWTIGAHGKSHRTLSMVSPQEQQDEIDDSVHLVNKYWPPCHYFAYPYGDRIHFDGIKASNFEKNFIKMAFTTCSFNQKNFNERHYFTPRINTNQYFKKGKYIFNEQRNPLFL